MSTLEDIKRLREQTGAGMMSAKRALEESNGDFEQAITVLRKAGEASAAKRADREASQGLIESYVHSGRIGVLVEVNCETDFVARTDDFIQFTHDIAMQIAATNPEYINPNDVPKDILDKESELYRSELTNKPPDMVEKIVDGKLDKYYSNVCLMRQPFVKDPDKSIEQLTTALIAKLGENIVVRRFERMELGVY
jgi:elongation factor Ts